MPSATASAFEPAKKPIAFVDGGVDYLTCSYNEDAEHTRLSRAVRHVRDKLTDLGFQERKWGHSGYVGHQVGGLEWGTRHDGVLVRLSGVTAQSHWRQFGTLSTNCSRIDVQETVVFEEPWAEAMQAHWQQMLAHWEENPKRPQPKVICGPLGPETIYSGNRQSDTFLRCYHRGSRKGCEDSLGHIRYEVELKNGRARATLTHLLSSRTPGPVSKALVFTQFHNRGCSLSWSNVGQCRIRLHIPASDAYRRLTWLRRAVRPTVQYLLESGMQVELLEALGLQQMVQRHKTAGEETQSHVSFLEGNSQLEEHDGRH